MPWDTTTGDWETLGERDPFWAVLSDDSYRLERISDIELSRFLKSGEDYVEDLWQRCQKLFGDSFAPRRALDFGCGVGRIVLPLARRTSTVVAVDAADSMLRRARALLDRHHITNVELVQGDALSNVDGPFDLVHSVIVFQHIPVSRGLKLMKRLVALAEDGGIVVIHVLYENPFRRAWPIRVATRALRPFRRLRRRLPEIQMNPYPLGAVFRLLHEVRAQTVHVELTDHAGHLGATFLFRKGGPR